MKGREKTAQMRISVKAVHWQGCEADDRQICRNKRAQDDAKVLEEEIKGMELHLRIFLLKRIPSLFNSTSTEAGVKSEVYLVMKDRERNREKSLKVPKGTERLIIIISVATKTKGREKLDRREKRLRPKP